MTLKTEQLGRDFIELSNNFDIVWIGEIHGIQENYSTYKLLITNLSQIGFKTIIWEMPADFSERSGFLEDGRVNDCSIEFLKWLKNLLAKGILEELSFFGDAPGKAGNEREEEMSRQVTEKLGQRSIVISGNIHMGVEANNRLGIVPCSEYVYNRIKKRILKIQLFYSHGTIYNYGEKTLKSELKSVIDMNQDIIELGPIIFVKGSDSVIYKVGKASAIKKPD